MNQKYTQSAQLVVASIIIGSILGFALLALWIASEFQ